MPRRHDRQRPANLFGADDGTRTRDPHLGKAPSGVRGVHSTPLTWTDAVGISTKCAQFHAVVERSTT